MTLTSHAWVLRTVFSNSLLIVCLFLELRKAEVDVLTLGQYMRPTKKHMRVHEYVKPEVFERYQVLAEERGFKYVASGPLVRSSYKAGEFYISNMLKKEREQSTPVVGNEAVVKLSDAGVRV